MKLWTSLLLLLVASSVQAQTSSVAIPIPSQVFAGVAIDGKVLYLGTGEVRGKVAFDGFERRVDGISVSLGSGYATLYFGEEVVTSDYMQVRGRVVDWKGLYFLTNARVTALRLGGVDYHE